MPNVYKQRLQITCEVCGSVFETLKKTRRFCSHSCSNKWVANNRTVTTRTLEQDVERFWSFVNKDGPIHPTLKTRCWLWTGKKSGKYGRVYILGKSNFAHRFSYELKTNSSLGQLLACHKCDNPLCVNPTHLFAGTAQDNSDDMWAKGRAVIRTGLVNGIAKQHANDPTLARGENNANSLLTEADVLSIRNRFRRDGPRRSNLKQLSEEFGVSDNMISQIVRRKRWSHVE